MSRSMMEARGEQIHLSSETGSGAQQQRNPGPSPQGIVTHSQQEPRLQAPQSLPLQVHSALHRAPRCPVPPPTHRPPGGSLAHGRQGAGIRTPKNTSRSVHLPPSRQLGWLGIRVSRTQHQSSRARPEPGACCSVSSTHPQRVTTWPGHVRSNSELVTFLPQAGLCYLPDVLPRQDPQ